MTTLRQRFLLATALLLGLQLASTALALVSWRTSLESARREQLLADWRAEVAAVGTSVREQYVHQAHTYIEGGATHLDHGLDNERRAAVALDRVAQLPLPASEEQLVSAVIRDHVLMTAYFHEQVEPVARAGGLDRRRAAELHLVTEQATTRITANLDRVLADLDAYQANERDRARRATGRAWWATVGLTLGGFVLVAAVGRALARAVLAPVDTIRAVAHGFVEPPDGRDELGEIASAFDIVTRRLSVEQERRVRAERLAALGELSAAIAHELMNPLTVILGDLKLRGDPTLQPIREEAEHARRVVDGLLGFARPGREAAVDADITAIAREAIDRIVPHAEMGEIRIELRGDRVMAVVSPSAVRQVVENLVRNAVQASPRGGLVEVDVQQGPTLSVFDRGSGIPAVVRQRLYEPFVTGRAEGTGLGLAVCQRIVRAHGGRLRHEDRDGGGTVAVWSFRFDEVEG